MTWSKTNQISCAGVFSNCFIDGKRLKQDFKNEIFIEFEKKHSNCAVFAIFSNNWWSFSFIFKVFQRKCRVPAISWNQNFFPSILSSPNRDGDHPGPFLCTKRAGRCGVQARPTLAAYLTTIWAAFCVINGRAAFAKSQEQIYVFLFCPDRRAI